MSVNIYDINFDNSQELSQFLLNTTSDKWKNKIIRNNKEKFISLKPWCQSLSEVKYCLEHNINEQPRCKYCNGLSSFVDKNYGYTTFCSIKCQNQFRLNDLHYQENLSDDELKQILKEFCETHHCSTWKLSNKDINFCAKNIIERTSFLEENTCFRERLYYINNDLYEIPLCPVCKKKHLRWLNNLNCYTKTCGDKKCKIIQRGDLNLNVTIQKNLNNEIVNKDELIDIVRKYNSRFSSSLEARQYFNSIMYYTSFLHNSATISERVYCLINNINEIPKCKECGQKVRWDGHKYYNFCCCTCAAKK